MAYEDEYIVINGRSVKRSSVIFGRPDFADHDFGKTQAKKFPPYVFSTNGNASLVHKVRGVTIHWYSHEGEYLVKRQRPKMTVDTMCGVFFFLKPDKTRTCTIPAADAVLCGRCHGQGPVFPGPNRTRWRKARQLAHVKLGCVMEGR